jgi:hypothetical protein
MRCTTYFAQLFLFYHNKHKQTNASFDLDLHRDTEYGVVFAEKRIYECGKCNIYKSLSVNSDCTI